MKSDNLILFVAVFIVLLAMLVVTKPKFLHQQDVELPQMQHPNAPPPNYQPNPPAPPPPPIPTPSISTPIPSYLPYPGIIKQLQTWEQEAPKLTEVGKYGKTSRGQDIYYIRLTNEQLQLTLDDMGGGSWHIHPKPRLLITACIHGNEPHSTSTVMAYIGSMLAAYGKDEQITKLIDGREIYFVPVVSPDSYPNSRHVDGVDPNRDYKNLRSAPVRAIQQFFNEKKFQAAWSGHTWGRVFLTPWGDNMEPCPDDEAYRQIMGEVAEMCQYRRIRACEMYQGGGGLNNPPIRYGEPGWGLYGNNLVPIYGAEMDWYYRHGAFAVVCEYGTHQRIPSDADTKGEFDRTFKGFLHFVDKAPIVKLKLTPGSSEAIYGENQWRLNE